MSRKPIGSLLLEHTEQREPLLTLDRDGEFVSYEDEKEIERRMIRNQKTSRNKFCVFVVLAVLVIAAVGIGVYFLSDNVKYHPIPDGPAPSPSILGKYKHAAIAADLEVCSNIGKDILQKKGSSVDAAIAILSCYSITQPQSSGIAGGFFMTIYDTTSKKSTSIDARERAPGAATEDMYEANPDDSMYGGRSVAVPGEIAGYGQAHKKFGKLKWSELFQSTIKLAQDGFNVGENLAHNIHKYQHIVKSDPDLSKTYTNPDTGDLFKEGEKMKLTKQADTLQKIADNGAEAFYTGELSKDIIQDLKEKGSVITAEDLKNYTAIVSESLSYQMRDGSVLYAPPLPSGGAVLIFIMNILDGYGIKPEDLDNKEKRLLAYHRIIEAFKFAYAKRTDLGDPAFEDMKAIVGNLTSRNFADSIRRKITDDKTHEYRYYGPTYYDRVKISTAHLSVVGDDGLAVSVTSTVNLHFGSGVMGSRTGLLFNDEMDDFSSPNQTNYFGVAPSPANFIKPGKRPLSSMCPAVLVDKDNKIKMVVGAAGGTKITTSTAFVMLRVLWFGDNIKQALDARRIHDQLLPPQVEYEDGFDQYYVNGLKNLGHNMTKTELGGSIVEAIESKGDYLYANGDFRRPGTHPAGF